MPLVGDAAQHDSVLLTKIARRRALGARGDPHRLCKMCVEMIEYSNHARIGSKFGSLARSIGEGRRVMAVT